jgi:hypothetical protein
VALAFFAAIAPGCAAAVHRPPSAADFFPLAPNSWWEYAVSRRAGAERFRFVATVRQDEFTASDGHPCRIVDERYGDVSGGERFPVVYCAKGGFLHRVMSLEYRGESLQDNGLRSGELKFLPTDLGRTDAWEGLTNAYRLPDGSGFEVQQQHQVAPAPERVVVPAGTFERCARVDTTAIHTATGSDGAPVGPRILYYYRDWYAPGVGLVKTEQRDADADVLATIELVHYAIGGEPATR